MIKATIELNGVKQKKDIPTRWEDLTFSQYMRILRLEKDDIAEILSIFTGIEKQTIVKCRIQGMEEIMASLDFMLTKPEFDKVPDTVLGVTIPKDVTFEILGPYLDCKNIIAEYAKKDVIEFTSSFPKYCAIYIQAVQSGWEGYDYEKAMLLLPELDKCPASEVVGLGAFFITKFVPLSKNTTTNSPKAVTAQKKSRRVSKS